MNSLLMYRRTGNSRATVLRGSETVKLAWLMAVFPRINAAEINVFLYNSIGRIRFYSPSQIYRTQDRIGLSRKRSSTTAVQAALPINQQKRWSYWNLPYLFGIADIRTVDIIDLDEAAVFAETANRGHGKSHLSTRCRDDGIYGHSQKNKCPPCNFCQTCHPTSRCCILAGDAGNWRSNNSEIL